MYNLKVDLNFFQPLRLSLRIHLDHHFLNMINKKYSAIWPNISKKQEPMKDHEKFKNIKDKYDKHFSEKPGK